MTITKTVTYNTIDLEITYDFQPEEDMVMYYPDGSGYPGCAASAEIYEVKVNGTIITELFTEEQIEELEELALED